MTIRVEIGKQKIGRWVQAEFATCTEFGYVGNGTEVG